MILYSFLTYLISNFRIENLFKTFQKRFRGLRSLSFLCMKSSFFHEGNKMLYRFASGYRFNPVRSKNNLLCLVLLRVIMVTQSNFYFCFGVNRSQLIWIYTVCKAGHIGSSRTKVKLSM